MLTMMRNRFLVLDANILIRAVLGKRVFRLVSEFSSTAHFFAPDVAFADAEKYLPRIFEKRNLDWVPGALMLQRLCGFVQQIGFETYSHWEVQARQRIRDVRDWPILAAAMALECPVWTEDQDFFGSGVATWTTDKVELYLRE